MLNEALEYAHNNRQRFLDELFQLLRIPSISALSEHYPDMERAAGWLADELKRIGFDNVQVFPSDGPPFVYGEWLKAGEGAPTILVYGHYDVQPVDPIEEWDSPPFEPEIRDGKMFARGASDDKGQAYIHLKVAESLFATSGRLPVNIKIFFEGEEEIGSLNLDRFVETHTELLAADSALISDSRILAPDQPSIVYRLRGLTYMQIDLKGPRRDLHSGSYGGSVYNPAQAIADIVAALHDDNGTVTIPGFYDKVRPLTDRERAVLAKVPYTLDDWRKETGLDTPWGEKEYTFLERVTIRPTCEINGIWGGFSGEGAKTVLPAEAGAKVSMRLVPDQDPQEIADLFTSYVKQLAGDDLNIDVITHSTGWWSISPLDSPETSAASRAYEAVFGKEPVFTAEGGSIPVVATFQKELGIPTMLMGFGLEDNVHSPNENFRVDHFHKGIDTVIHYLCFLAGSEC